MALTACPECKTDVSDTAFDCPSCGAALKKPKRSLFGKLCLWTFIAFNLLMVFWIVGGVSGNVENMETMSSAEQTGAAIGTGLGVAMLIALWVAGDFILGLFTFFTRPKKA